MQTRQAQWAAQLRAVPGEFSSIVISSGETKLRHRPAEGEWSAIEVVGHIVDKMQNWGRRAERVASEDNPTLVGYDQDEHVRQNDYQHADPQQLLAQLEETCENFARIVEGLPDSALERSGMHTEYGPISLVQCIEMPLDSITDHKKQFLEALNS